MGFSPTSTAVVGQAITATVTDTPTPLSVVAMGSSSASAPGIGALPFDLGVIGMTGCTLYQSGDVFGLPTTSAGVAFQMSFTAALPPTPALVGQHLYFQAFSVAPGVNPLQVVASNGVDFLLGNQ